MLIDPATHDEYRLTIIYERTERRGPVFERLREDVDAVAALTGMTDVFRLRAADIYRIMHIDHVNEAKHAGSGPGPVWGPLHRSSPELVGVGELCRRL